MSLRLNQSTRPLNLCVKAWGAAGITIGDYEISAADFHEVVRYWLQTVDIHDGNPDDHRMTLAQEIADHEIVEGYNGPKSRRIQLPDRPPSAP